MVNLSQLALLSKCLKAWIQASCNRLGFKPGIFGESIIFGAWKAWFQAFQSHKWHKSRTKRRNSYIFIQLNTIVIIWIALRLERLDFKPLNHANHLHNFAPLWTIWNGFQSSHDKLGTNLACFLTLCYDGFSLSVWP